MRTPKDSVNSQIAARWTALQPRIRAFIEARAQEDSARQAAIDKMQSGSQLTSQDVRLIYADADPEYLQQMLQFYAAQ